MKKVLFLLTFFAAVGLATASAQSCGGASAASAGKSCCANKAAKAAAADATIEKRTADDGSVAYVRKESDAQGNVKFVSVQFDEASNAFVNVAPKGMAASDKEGMTKKSASCSGEKKAGCGSASAGKSCCASKAAKAETPAPAPQ
ncbi:MAG: hypothetical protein ACK4Q5_08865 [Saprospiraceae bacterium]